MDLKYIENRKAFEAHFSTCTEIEDSREEFVSPSGLYKLQVSKYGPGKYPAYSRGIVTRQSDGKIIADVKRNIGHFWYVWAEHPNGNEYLLCGEDYQGYSVLNLSSASYHAYFPEEGYEGRGFCWAVVYPSPDNDALAVDGCYWGGTTEIVFYDFQTPDRLPYKELGRESNNLVEAVGWLNNETFQAERELTLRKSDGALYDDLSEAEQDEIDRGQVEAEYRTVKVQITKPPFC